MKYLLCFVETIINCEGDFVGLFPAEWKRLIEEELKQFQNKKNTEKLCSFLLRFVNITISFNNENAYILFLRFRHGMWLYYVIKQSDLHSFH